jgi:hypothetical protein
MLTSSVAKYSGLRFGKGLTQAVKAEPEVARRVSEGSYRCQADMVRCSRNVRSSSLCKVESSALIGHGGRTRGTVDVSKRAGSAEGAARSQEAAHHPEAGRGGVGNQRALGADIGEAAAAEGDSALRHRLRGRPSNRKTPEAVKRRVLELFRQKQQAKLWHDYGPTLAAEELAEDHGIRVNRETLRQWLMEAKLWRARRSRIERAHLWRPRGARYGELVQWDSSEHNWLEGRGEKLYLISMIDDATSQLTAHFVRHDSTEENLEQLRRYVEQHGRPVAVYTDKASLFQIAPRAIHHRDAPQQQLSQIGRALQELNIEWIAAHSPQAKGRIERSFQTAQDRLVKGWRRTWKRRMAIWNKDSCLCGMNAFVARRNWRATPIVQCPRG